MIEFCKNGHRLPQGPRGLRALGRAINEGTREAKPFHEYAAFSSLQESDQISGIDWKTWRVGCPNCDEPDFIVFTESQSLVGFEVTEIDESEVHRRNSELRRLRNGKNIRSKSACIFDDVAHAWKIVEDDEVLRKIQSFEIIWTTSSFQNAIQEAFLKKVSKWKERPTPPSFHMIISTRSSPLFKYGELADVFHDFELNGSTAPFTAIWLACDGEDVVRLA